MDSRWEWQGMAMPYQGRKTRKPALEALEARWNPSAIHLAPAVRIPTAVAVNLGATGGATTRGTIQSSEVDFFLISPKWTATYDVRVSPVAGSALDPVTAIYTSKGQRIALNDNEGPGSRASLLGVPLSAGQSYYVAVTNQRAERGGYTLAVQAKLADDSCENNDALSSATSLGAVSAPLTVDNLVMADAADWYSFSLAQANAGAMARLDTNAGNGTLIFELYGSTGSRISLASAGGIQTLDLSRQGAGQYFLKVSGSRGGWNSNYSLRLDPGQVSSPPGATPPSNPPAVPTPPSVAPAPSTPPAGSTPPSATPSPGNPSVSVPPTVTPLPGTDLPVVSEPDPPGPTVPGNWTILVYMTAGNLASFAQSDVNELEILASTLPAGSRIGLFWDQWDQQPIATGGGSQAPWGSAGRAVVASDAASSAISTNFELLGERNSGDRETLSSFLSWGRQTLPAARTALVLWNHGSGLGGSNYDSESSDHLTIAETAGAIASQNGWRPDILAYDACLMAMAENAYGLRQSANYLVASQESVEGAGFPYAQSFAALATPNAAVADVVAGMVGAYSTATTGSTEATLSAIRLQGMDALATALLSFTTQAAQGNATDLAAFRRILTTGAVGMYTEASYRDLRSFMVSLGREDSVSASIRTAAGRVVSCLDAAIEAKTADYRSSGGLSIYMPRTPAEEISDFMDHSAFIQATEWTGFVNQVIGRQRGAPLGGVALDPTAAGAPGRGTKKGLVPSQASSNTTPSTIRTDMAFLAWLLADEASKARPSGRR